MNDQNTLIAIYSISVLLIAGFAIMMTIFLIIHKQRQVKNRLERQQLEHHYNSELLKTRIEVQEQALQMVSQEIHDNIGQVLSFSRMQLASLREYIHTEGPGRQLLNENLDLIKRSIKELRLLSHSLNTGLVEKRELEEAIQTELDRIQVFGSIACTMKVEGTQEELKPETRLLIFRIIQEALQNVVKHAKATKVTIELHYTANQLEVSVADDGMGFSPSLLANNATLGMTNMNQRAALLGGELQITSARNKGATITLKLPINN